MCYYKTDSQRSIHFTGFYIGLDNQTFERKIVNIFLHITFNVCFGCSKESSLGDGSFGVRTTYVLIGEIRQLFFYYKLSTKILHVQEKGCHYRP